ncbi:MAG: beta-propeller domain-containing protein [Oscillospiraceae bacterium]|nr:beta-propeller domain-containing protein [Oscillospiraceae bacterium]
MKTYDERCHDIRCKLEQKKQRRRTRTTVIALSCCLVLVLGLCLAIRPESPPVVTDVGYAPLIQELTRLTESKDDLLTGETPLDHPELALPDAAIPDQEADDVIYGDDGTYKEVTDVQVAGIIEADLIKRSDSHIFYLKEDTLTVYTIEGAYSEQVGSYQLQPDEGTSSRTYTYDQEMYLSQDCDTVTILANSYDHDQGQKYLYILSLDVSDPCNIRQAGHTFITGSYKTSRLIGQELYIFSNYYVDSGFDPEDETTFLPGHGVPEEMTYLSMEDICIPEAPTSAMYTIVSKMDVSTLEMKDTQALLSYTGSVYVSHDNIFLTRSYTDRTKNGHETTVRDMTQIAHLSDTGNGLDLQGTFSVEGHVKDQYSMDEKDGILRIVTTIDSYTQIEQVDGELASVTLTDQTTNASLYCVDLHDHSIRASVERFAPEGESVQSVRFKDDQAYVCTSIILSDPVFFFDLSDLDHISHKDTGTIDGYSMSLVDFKDGFLMGIGYGNSFDTLKIEIYREGSAGVESHCAYQLSNCWFSPQYKSYYIDRDDQLIGLGVDRYDSGTRYILLHFDGYELVELLDLPMEGDVITMRSVYIDDYLYILGDTFHVEKIL